MENRDRDNFLRTILERNDEIIQLKEKLHRRNMLANDLRKKASELSSINGRLNLETVKLHMQIKDLKAQLVSYQEKVKESLENIRKAGFLIQDKKHPAEQYLHIANNILVSLNV